MAVSQSLTVTEVPNSVSIADNTNQVEIVWTSTQTGESWNGYTRTAYYWVSINGGAETKYSVSYTLPKNSTKTIVSKTITVKHNGDGTGKVKVRTWMDTDISAKVVELSKDLTLTTIPRASTLDSLTCASQYFTGTMTYKYTPKSSVMYNRCNISLHLGDEFISVKSVNLGQKAASQQTATVTLSANELATVYNQLPSDKEGTLRFTFRTYSDAGYSTQVGDYVYREITLKIPDDKTTKPTVGMSLSPVGNLPNAFDGLYVQGKTRVKATLTAEPKYNAKATAYRMTVDGGSYGAGDGYTSKYLTKTGSTEVIGYATDSRGFTGEMPKSITVIPYAKPKLLNVSALRCNENGEADDSGAYLRIRAQRSYNKVESGGVQRNFCLIRYRWKPENGVYKDDEWVTILAKTAGSDTVDTGALPLSLSATTSYLVQIQAVDDIGEYAETFISVPTEEVYMHRTKNAMGLGTYVNEERLLDVAWDAHFRGEVKIGDKTLREYILSIIEGG